MLGCLCLLLTENRRNPKKEPELPSPPLHFSPRQVEGHVCFPDSLRRLCPRRTWQPEARGRRRLCSRSGTLGLSVWQVYGSWFGFHLALSFHLLALPSPCRSTFSPDSHVAAQRSPACAQQVTPASFTAGWAFCNEIFEGILLFLSTVENLP